MKINNIKLVMSDIDDTLLDSNKVCSPTNAKAIKQLKEHGIKFGIASGRPCELIPRFFKEWDIEGLVDYVVGSNGAELLDVKNNKIYNFNFLSIDIIKEIERKYHDYDMSVCVYHGNELRANKAVEEYNSRLKIHKLEKKIIDFKKDISQEYPKVLGVANEDEVIKVLTNESICKTEDYRCFPSASTLLEFVNPLLSKTFGINEICKLEKISSENVMTFGDTSNDVEMLRDFNGVCMSNGTDDAKSVAKYICGSNNESGLGKFIFEHLL